MTDHHVIVVGAGYAGCMAANRLQATGAAQVTLIDPNPRFVERIRLHQLAAATGTATLDFAELLHPAIDRVEASVMRIDAPARVVHLTDAREIAYDAVVYAVGSVAAEVTVPGAHEHAHRLGDHADGLRLAQRVADSPADSSIVVVGGGLTGVEVAAEMARTRAQGSVTIVCGGGLVPSAGPRGARSVRRRLSGLGVEIIEGVAVTEVAAAKITLADGRAIASDITIWTVGFAVPGLATDSGLATDTTGRLLVDDTLVSVSDPRVIGAGDAVAIGGTDLRMSCQAALPLGAQAAGTARAVLAGDPPGQVDQGFAAQCIGLGRDGGTVVATDRDDNPRRIVVGGRIGGLIKEQICRKTVRWIAGEGRRGGSYTWPHGPR